MLVRAVALSGLLIGAGLIWAQDGTLDFKEFTSKDGQYKVSVPGVMKTSHSKPTVKGKAVAETEFHLAVSEVGQGRQFAITYFDLPNILGEAERKTLLSTLGSEAKEDGWKVLMERSTTIGKDKEFAQDILSQKEMIFQRQRVVVSGKRVYQVIVTGSKDFVTSKDADRFVASFSITR